MKSPIGIFDSGYGGLTVFRSIRDELPDYDYLYFGDNARAPYGSRSFESIHEYTWQSIQWMLDQGCPLVIVACNTSSARALRTIQQIHLPQSYPDRRVLGVIRPTAEVIGDYTHTNHVGVLGTQGTVQSSSYLLEIAKFFPELKVFQQACPLWVPMIEANELEGPGADFIVEKYLKELLDQSADIDCVLLACTHYPLLAPLILEHLPVNIRLISQGQIVAKSLHSYLERHPEMESRISRNGALDCFTTDSAADFEAKGTLFLGAQIQAKQVHL